MPLLRRSAREPRPQHIRLRGREIEARGLASGFWSDLYYRSMTVSWPGFFAGAAIIFIVLNSAFALLYSLGNQPVANAVPGRFLDLIYFSIETLATVGYGDMHPQTDYGHLVATVEIFTGMSFLAVMTGLVFSRFSRPRARFMFAQHPIVTAHEGQPTLMIRVANARHNIISGAIARPPTNWHEPKPCCCSTSAVSTTARRSSSTRAAAIRRSLSAGDIATSIFPPTPKTARCCSTTASSTTSDRRRSRRGNLGSFPHKRASAGMGGRGTALVLQDSSCKNRRLTPAARSTTTRRRSPPRPRPPAPATARSARSRRSPGPRAP